MKTFTIIASLLPQVTTKLENFRYKFSKYGNGDLIYDVSGKRREEDKTSRFYNQVVVDIEVDAKYQIEGYEFIASLEWDEKSQQNLIKKISDDVCVPREYRYKTDCDHCKTNRFRKYTILLKKEDKYIQVGKSCVRDYVGRDFGDYLSYLSCFDTIDKYIESLLKDYSFSKIDAGFKVDDVLLQTLEYVKRFGYISKRNSIENETNSTASMIYYALNKVTNIQGEILYKIYEISDESIRKLEDIKAFLNNFSDDNDYVNNLKIISRHDWVDNDNLGLVVSIIGWYFRETAKIKQGKNTQPSEYIGQVGEKISFTATPTCISSYETQYGLCYIYKFEVGNGDIIIWKTQKSLDEASITVRGTVKAHSIFRGEKQTEITRCRIF